MKIKKQPVKLLKGKVNNRLNMKAPIPLCTKAPGNNSFEYTHILESEYLTATRVIVKISNIKQPALVGC